MQRSQDDKLTKLTRERPAKGQTTQARGDEDEEE
jgi:hypothetical protein